MTSATKPTDTEKTGPSRAARWTCILICSLSIAGITYAIDVLAIVSPEVIAGIGVTPVVIHLGNALLLVSAAAVTMFFGELADRFGPKNIFLWVGCTVFAAGGLLVSFADGSLLLVIGRIVLGIGSLGFAIPALQFANIMFPVGDKGRGVAFGLIGMGFGIGFALAPIVGGALADAGSFGWRAANLVPVLIAVICFVGISTLVEKTPAARLGKGLDVIGSLLLAGALGFLIFGLNMAATYGWLTDATRLIILGWTWSLPISFPFLLFILSGVCLIGFAPYEIHRNHKGVRAVLDMQLFKNRTFSTGLIPCALFFFGSLSAILIFPRFFLLVLGYDAIELGLALLPIGVGITLFAYLAGPIGDAITGRLTVVIGFALIAIGAIFGLLVFNLDSNGLLTFGPLFVFGAGFGLVYSRITEVVMSGVPPKKAGLGGATLFAVRVLAGAIGTALLSILLISTATDEARSEVASDTQLTVEQRDDLDTLLFQSGRLTQEAGGLNRMSGVDSRSTDDMLTNAEYGDAIDDIKAAWAHGSRISVIAVAIVAVLGLLTTLLLPKPKKT